MIAILNTWSDINSCHTHLRLRADVLRRGILQAGGFPVELPGISLSEQYVKPTKMLHRNLLAMDVEELLRCHPVDGVVLPGLYCDRRAGDHLRCKCAEGLILQLF
jgi:dihydroxyacid dehydratase/phosphogluconate dehydratase